MSAFVSLFSGNKLNVAVLTDLATGQDGNRREVEALRKSGVLEATRIFTAADFTGTAEADIEDLWGADAFAAILNGAYNLDPRLTGTDLTAALPSTNRLLKKAEEWFRSSAGRPTFDHFTPASWLIQHPELLEQNIATFGPALARFEAFFKKANPLVV